MYCVTQLVCGDRLCAVSVHKIENHKEISIHFEPSVFFVHFVVLCFTSITHLLLVRKKTTNLYIGIAVSAKKMVI